MGLIDLKIATGDDLDAAGKQNCIFRNPNEGDASYRSRLIAHEEFYSKPFLDPADYAKTHGEYGGRILSRHMTLRDYFAAKATKEDVQEMRYLHMDKHPKDCEFIPLEWVEAKYKYADLMLAERAK